MPESTNAPIGDHVVLYVGPNTELALPLDRDHETIWVTQAQMAELFGIDRSRVTRHIANVFRDDEVEQESNVRKAHIASSDKPVTYYSLDVTLAVGYRSNSARAITFRRWASDVLKDFLLSGIAVNERRLDDLGSVVRLLARSENELVAGVADVLVGYLPSLRLLREYDEGTVSPTTGNPPAWELTSTEARGIIDRIAQDFPQDTLFGHDPTGKLDGTISAIYLGFGGYDIYPTVESKAANLLYLVVKDHALSDGNKRSAAALFVTFLDRNELLLDNTGQPRFSNNALAALTLMVAMSDPSEKALMVALIEKMISPENELA